MQKLVPSLNTSPVMNAIPYIEAFTSQLKISTHVNRTKCPPSPRVEGEKRALTGLALQPSPELSARPLFLIFGEPVPPPHHPSSSFPGPLPDPLPCGMLLYSSSRSSPVFKHLQWKDKPKSN